MESVSTRLVSRTMVPHWASPLPKWWKHWQLFTRCLGTWKQSYLWSVFSEALRERLLISKFERNLIHIRWTLKSAFLGMRVLARVLPWESSWVVLMTMVAELPETVSLNTLTNSCQDRLLVSVNRSSDLTVRAMWPITRLVRDGNRLLRPAQRLWPSSM